MGPRKASAAATTPGSDRWIHTRAQLPISSSTGFKRAREDDGAVVAVTTSTTTTAVGAAPPSSSSQRNAGVSITLSTDRTHWLESLYSRSLQNCLSYLASEQARHEEECIDGRATFDVELARQQRVFVRKLDLQCAAKRKQLMGVSKPASSSFSLLSQEGYVSGAGTVPAPRNETLDFLAQFSDDEDPNPAKEAPALHSGSAADVGTEQDNHEEEGPDGLSDGDSSGRKKGSTSLAKRTQEVDAAVEAFRQERMQAYRADEAKLRQEKEDTLLQSFPLGNLEGDEQAVLLYELGAVWREKLAEIANPDSSLRQRLSGSDRTLAARLISGDNQSSATGSCLRHLTSGGGSGGVAQSPYFSTNPDSTLLDLIASTAQRHMQRLHRNAIEPSSPIQPPTTPSLRPASLDSVAAETTDDDDESVPIALLYPDPNRSDFDPSFSSHNQLLGAMAHVARLQAKISREAEQRLLRTRSAGIANHACAVQDEMTQYLVSAGFSGDVASLQLRTTPSVPSTVGLTQGTINTSNPSPSSDTASKERVSTTSLTHLLRDSVRRTQWEEGQRRVAAETNRRAHIPIDYPADIMIHLGDVDDKETELIKGFMWPEILPSAPTTTENTQHGDQYTNDITTAALKGIPTLVGGCLRRYGDEWVVTGGSVLTVPEYRSAAVNAAEVTVGGEVALSSFAMVFPQTPTN